MSTEHAFSDVCELRLMDRIRDGDTAAFVELVDRWQPRLARFLRRLGAAWHDIDDLIQEIFLRVYSYRDRFEARHERAVAAFLLLVARRVHIDFARRRLPPSVLGSHGPKRAGLNEVETSACPRTPPATLRDDLIDLEGALRLLSPKLRKVVLLVARTPRVLAPARARSSRALRGKLRRLLSSRSRQPGDRPWRRSRAGEPPSSSSARSARSSGDARSRRGQPGCRGSLERPRRSPLLDGFCDPGARRAVVGGMT